MKMQEIEGKTIAGAMGMPAKLNRRLLPAMLALLSLCMGSPCPVKAQATDSTKAPGARPTLERRYHEGETLAYKMTGINQGHQRTIQYQARAEGAVKKDAAGNFIEEFKWTDLELNGGLFALSPASRDLRETLSLTPIATLGIPDLSKVQPILIGPITDLLAFYADGMLAMRQKELVNAGDHVLVKHGLPNSWADGTYVVFGQDAIDFDLTLQAVDAAANVATVLVRHLPPAQGQIKFPAAWMLNPVGNAANNWSEVERTQDGKFTAEVGLETFTVELKIALDTGRILSATMDNPVEVLERDCSDVALTTCGAPTQYRIRRQITLHAETTTAAAGAQ